MQIEYFSVVILFCSCLRSPRRRVWIFTVKIFRNLIQRISVSPIGSAGSIPPVGLAISAAPVGSAVTTAAVVVAVADVSAAPVFVVPTAAIVL